MQPIVGEIKLWAIDYAPKGWALCNGALLPINQNQALYSLLGTKYGGDGVTTFALPDLRGRVPAGFGQSAPTMGGQAGSETVTLTAQTAPQHIHFVKVTSGNGDMVGGLGNHIAAAVTRVDPITGVNLYAAAGGATVPLAPATVSSSGGNLAHDNMQPSLALNYCIATVGVYPSRP